MGHDGSVARLPKDPDLTTIFTSKSLWNMWRASPPGEPPELAKEWSRQFPALLDLGKDDLDLIKVQAHKGYHFAEWYAAIHLFGRDGARSLIEKYDTYANHRLGHQRRTHLEKVAIYESAVPEDHRAVHHEICARYGVQLPDLLVLAPESAYSFAEVKGATDGTLNSEGEVAMRRAIRKRLGVRVEVIQVRSLP
jgi:hypothetical protein